MQIRKNKMKIDLLKGETTEMGIARIQQSSEDALNILNTFGSPAICAVEGYANGNIIGALAGDLNNLDPRSISELYISLTDEGRIQSNDLEMLGMKNNPEINRLMAENRGLAALQQSYQNEMDTINEETERVLNE
jgi:hypothetical protein